MYWIEKRSIQFHLLEILFLICATVLSLNLSNPYIYFINVPWDLTKQTSPAVVYGALFESNMVYREYRFLTSQYNPKSYFTENIMSELSLLVNRIKISPHSILVGAQFYEEESNQTITILYSKYSLHGAEISFHLLINAVLKRMFGREYNIVTKNQLVPTVVKVPPNDRLRISWFFLFPFALHFYSVRFVSFLIIEKVTKFKQLQCMSGVDCVVYWMVSYTWNLLMYFLTTTFVILVFILYGTYTHNLFCGTDEIEAIFVTLIAYGCSMIAFLNVCSLKVMESNVDLGTTWNFSCLYFGYISYVIMTVISNHTSSCMWIYYLLLLLPQFSILSCTWNIVQSVKCKRLCKLRGIGNTKLFRKCGHCSYYFGRHGIGTNILIMFFSAVLYLTIVIAAERKIFQNWYHILRKKQQYQKRQTYFHGSIDVQYEADRVLNKFYEEKFHVEEPSPSMYDIHIIPDLLLTKNLRKSYGSHTVFNGISFSVKYGECFGLLGVNGSGKTSLFKILTGDWSWGEGEARIFYDDAFYSLSSNLKKYLELVGYCPQTNAIIDDLTGREILYLFAKLRGVGDKVEEMVFLWIKLLSLEKYADKLCRIYSTGSKRKLSVAIALIGSPVLVILDEPTIGIDHQARLKLWNVLSILYDERENSSLIFSTHNIEECEMLSDKLTILSKGQFQCFGKFSKLKFKYGGGFIVRLKLNYFDVPNYLEAKRTLSVISRRLDSSEINLENNRQLSMLMNDFATMYKGLSKLVYDQKNLLQFRITDKTKKWSEIYGEVEGLRQRHSIVEDYYISERNVDDLFLSITEV